MNMQLRAVTGRLLGMGVVKERRRIRGDVLNSTSPVHLSAYDCVGCLNWCSCSCCESEAEEEGTRLEMNLYRSFGNLMEAWISEGGQCSYSEVLGNNDEDPPTPSSHMETNLRSESVDSGVETASSDMSFHATSSSVSTENTEIDTFTPEREGDGFTQASESSVLSCLTPSSVISSSPCLCPSRDQEDSTTLQQKVEQALQRTNSKHVKDNPEPLTVDELLRRRPQASVLPKPHTSEVVRRQRSESFGMRRMVNPLVPMRQMRRRPMSMISDKLPSQRKLEELSEEEGKELSPGLSYLEQVCQMLEEIARQQMHNQASQREMNALREDQDTDVNQALDACQSDSRAADDDVSSCRRLENKKKSAQQSSSEPQRRKDYHRHFRQRSASDANIATLHLRELKADCRGQQLSIDDLLEKLKEDLKKQESKKDEKTSTITRNWKFKIGSLGRESSAVRDMKGQQMQSSEKNSARRRLSQLFRRNRRKTLPV